MKRLKRFIKKYDFPIHFIVILNQHITRRTIVSLSTTIFKIRLKVLHCPFGKNLKVDGMPILNLTRCGSLRFGKGCKINSRFKSNLVGRTNPTVFECVGEGSISLGDYSGLSFAILSSRCKIIIGNHVNIGGNVRIFDHNYHSLNYMDRRDGKLDKANCKTAPITIGDDVFIGTNAIILKGTTIGERSIIGAGSIVSGKIPPDEIWAGNPAICIKKKLNN